MNGASNVRIAVSSAIPATTGLRFESRSIALGTLCILTWALAHCYTGIVHDARLYTLQALAHVHPESLTHDGFLRYGSQDRFSIFGPLYAGVVDLSGPEVAATLLTFVSQAALAACAWLLARQLMPRSLALLALTVLLAIPGFYGAYQVFAVIEPFVTPRMLAEALVLASLTASLCERERLALVVLGMATVIHPVMAAAGIAALLWKHVGLAYPRVTTLLICLTALLLAALSYVLPPGRWGRFDATWLELVAGRTPYLFATRWRLDDWIQAAPPLATLLVAIRLFPAGRTRNLSRLALLAAVSGLALTLFACDLLHLVLFTQLQPWRWLWLSTAAAALLLPSIVYTAWQAGYPGRTTALLVITSWVFGADMIGVEVALAALVSAVFATRLRANEARLVFCGACTLFALAVVWRIASDLNFTDLFYSVDPQAPVWLRKVMSFTRDGAVPIAAAAFVWWLFESPRTRVAGIAAAALIGVTCVCIVPQIWDRWTHRQFPSALVQQFAPWRRLLPPAAEVFWDGNPLGTWLLLQRPSYISSEQTAGLVFSREVAMEMARRASTLGSTVTPAFFLSWEATSTGLGPEQLQSACASGQFQYLVTGAKLDRPSLAQLSRESWPVSGGLRLYDCVKRTG
jgi:hypothetical protein